MEHTRRGHIIMPPLMKYSFILILVASSGVVIKTACKRAIMGDEIATVSRLAMTEGRYIFENSLQGLFEYSTVDICYYVYF